MYGKSNMETYITICKRDSQWEFSIWFRKLKQGLCIKLEVWDAEGVGRKVQKGRDICIPMTVQPVHSEGDQPWDFFGRNDAKAETAVLWPPHAKS